MKPNFCERCLLLGLALTWSQSAAAAQAIKTTPNDEKLVKDVADALVNTEAFRAAYPSKYAFPPLVRIWNTASFALGKYNAFASANTLNGAVSDPKTGKIRPVVNILPGYIQDVIKGEAEVLAAILGHELAHITKDHVSRAPPGKTSFEQVFYSREQEIEADLDGLKWSLAAGYSIRGHNLAVQRIKKLVPQYTSFEGTSSTHPPWDERMALISKQQAHLWKAMGAFSTGARFLNYEQFPAAEKCFRGVLKEFPKCPDAWSNLGYALLMQYCDEMSIGDLRRYDLGLIVAGGFCLRPAWLEEQVRGPDDKLWGAAVKALEAAADLDPNAALPLANLGLAYLVHPKGKDAKRSAKYFDEAIQKETAGNNLDPLSLASLLVNAGVAELARGQKDAAVVKFTTALKASAKSPLTSLVRNLEDAARYNQALAIAGSTESNKRQEAYRLMENYLNLASPDTAWWALAYERYSKLGKELDRPVRSQKDLSKRFYKPMARRLASVKLASGETVTLSEDAREVVKRLGPGAVTIPVYAGTKLVRLRYPKLGIELLTGKKVLAVILSGKESPPVVLRGEGLTSHALDLRVGMSRKKFDEVMKGSYPDRTLRRIDDPDVGFRYYANPGLGVRFKNDQVEELALVQVPRRQFTFQGD